jgi:hypothetical protein
VASLDAVWECSINEQIAEQIQKQAAGNTAFQSKVILKKRRNASPSF